MPDHVHALLEACSSASDLRLAIDAWKQRTGYRHRRLSAGGLWQNGYFDCVLRQDDDRLPVIAYIINNPLRSALVTDAANYPFWGSGVYERPALLDAIQGIDGKKPGRWR